MGLAVMGYPLQGGVKFIGDIQPSDLVMVKDDWNTAGDFCLGLVLDTVAGKVYYHAAILLLNTNTGTRVASISSKDSYIWLVSRIDR